MPQRELLPPGVVPAPPAATPTLRGLELTRGRLRLAATKATGYGKARATEASVRFTLTRRSAVKVTVERVTAGRRTAVAKSSITLPQRTGDQALRVSTRVGRARLKPGLYRFLLTPTTIDRGMRPESHEVLLRVLRGR